MRDFFAVLPRIVSPAHVPNVTKCYARFKYVCQAHCRRLLVEFETSTEFALNQIFTSFETSLFIPVADPIYSLYQFVIRIQQRLEQVSSDTDGLKQLLLLHYSFASEINSFAKTAKLTVNEQISYYVLALKLRGFNLRRYAI
jgi:hypothetical protein